MGIKKLFKKAKRVVTGKRKPVKHKLGHTAKTYARLSSEAYSKNRQRKSRIHGYAYDKKLSSKRRAVYHNAHKKDTVVAYRGTVVGKKDLTRDLSIMGGKLGKTNEARGQVRAYDRTVSKYGKHVHVTGHSKGGSMAAHVIAQRKGASGHVFNAGAGYRDEKMSKSTRKRVDKKLTRHHIAGDVISVAGRKLAGKSKTYYAGLNPLKAHSIDNFT